MKDSRPEGPAKNGTRGRIRVWDLPLRLFHWLLVLAIIGSILSMETELLSTDLHPWFGYCALALIAFRLVWGLIGDTHSRFPAFLYGPGAILAYLRGGDDAVRARGRSPLGHNPLGSLSVWALLLSIGVQAVTGLFASDEISMDGPLVRAVSGSTVETMTKIHEINHVILYVLVGLHLAAILFYTIVKKKPLVAAMIHGNKDQPSVRATDMGVDRPARDSIAVWLRALIVMAVIAAGVWYLANWRPPMVM